MISGNTNQNIAPYVIYTPYSVNPIFDDILWTYEACLKNEYLHENEVRMDVEKLLYQLNKYHITYWNVKFFDKFIKQANYRQSYNQYLTKSRKFRKIHERMVEFEGEFMKGHKLEIRPDMFYSNEYNDIQIYGISIAIKHENGGRELHEHVEDKKEWIDKVYFNVPKREKGAWRESDEFAKKMDNIKMLYNQTEQKQSEIQINESNIGLAEFNYLLLHYVDQLPKIRILCNAACDLIVNIKYCKLSEEPGEVIMYDDDKIIVHEGWMSKQVKMLETWGMRYFTLDDQGQLECRKNKVDEAEVLIGDIRTIEKAKRVSFGKNRQFGIALHGTNGGWNFYCTLKREQDQWMDAINSIMNRSDDPSDAEEIDQQYTC